MKLLIADGKLIIETDDEQQFVITPCQGHGYHTKLLREVSLTEVPREFSVSEAHALTDFIAKGFAI